MKLSKLLDHLKNNQAFTLVEMLLYMGLLSIFIVILSNLFSAIFDIKYQNNTNSFLDQDNKFIFSRIENDLRRSDLVASPAANLPPNNKSNRLIMKIGTDTYEYSLSDENLRLGINGIFDHLNSSEIKVTNLEFERIGNSLVGLTRDLVKVKLTLQSRNAAVNEDKFKNYELVVGLR